MKKILVGAAAFGCVRGPSWAGKTEIPDYSWPKEFLEAGKRRRGQGTDTQGARRLPPPRADHRMTSFADARVP